MSAVSVWEISIKSALGKLRDSFDRLLISQATAEPMILLTNDAALAGYESLVTVV